MRVTASYGGRSGGCRAAIFQLIEPRHLRLENGPQRGRLPIGQPSGNRVEAEFRERGTGQIRPGKRRCLPHDQQGCFKLLPDACDEIRRRIVTRNGCEFISDGALFGEQVGLRGRHALTIAFGYSTLLALAAICTASHPSADAFPLAPNRPARARRYTLYATGTREHPRPDSGHSPSWIWSRLCRARPRGPAPRGAWACRHAVRRNRVRVQVGSQA